jgi:hypothetical protein
MKDERMTRPPQAREHESAFVRSFTRSAHAVRGRLALRHVLSGATLGIVVALALAIALWRGRSEARRFAPALVIAGAAMGAAVARRRRWSDLDVALYLDDHLAGREAIATALGIGPMTTPVAEALYARGGELLQSPAEQTARPRSLRRAHALLPVLAAPLAVVLRAPLPAAPVVPVAPGAAKVTLANTDGLRDAAGLQAIRARDAAQRERFERIAKDAEKLKDDLRKGIEKRAALDKIARLKDEIAEERMSLGAGEQRAGLESAVGRLGAQGATKQAARALGDHDLEAMDAEMERLANARETDDRERAKQALEEAARAAREAGASDVADALEDAKNKLDARGRRADLVRELADAMAAAGDASEALKSEAESLDRTGSDEAAKKLAESLRKALENLTPEERKRLAEKLGQMQRQSHGRARSGDLKDLADRLSSDAGAEQLEEQLRDLANQDDESDESRREGALDDAESGLDGAERQLGGADGADGVPMPMPGKGRGRSRGRPNHGHGGDANAAGGPGSHDTGTGSHEGHTDKVDGDPLKARVKGPMNASRAMPGAVTTFAPGHAGGVAGVAQTGDLALGRAGAKEIDGVEKNDVPEEYRDQVRQNFQP